MKNKKKMPKYNNGGDLASAITPMATMGLDLALPGAGTALAPVLGSIINQVQQSKNQSQVLNDHYNSVQVKTNPYQMEMGGQLTGSEQVAEFTGASHSQGGIGVNPDGVPTNNPMAEVEGEETKTTIGGKTYIFSKTLTI